MQGAPPSITHVMASGEVGGGAEHVVGLVRELVALGLRQSAIVGSNGVLADRLRGEGIIVHTLEMMKSRADLRIALSIRRLVHDLRPDLVHAHGTRAGLLVAASLSGPFVYTAHGLAYRHGRRCTRPLRLMAEGIVCRSARSVISVSRTDLHDLRRRRAIAADRGYYIPNAVDASRFAARDRVDARRRLTLDPQAFVVGTVSRLVPQKAVADLIDAVVPEPDLQLVIVGDGPLRDQLERRALPARSRIRFLGSRDDVAEILPALDVFVLSSHWEGEPIALLEAMAAGLPVVATRTSGAVDTLEGGAGLLVPIGAPAEIAAGIRRIRDEPELGERLRLRSRALVGSRTWARAASRALSVYRAAAHGVV